MSFSEEVNDFLNKHKINKNEVIRRLECDSKMFDNFLKGKITLPIKYRSVFCQILQLDISAFIDGEIQSIENSKEKIRIKRNTRQHKYNGKQLPYAEK